MATMTSEEIRNHLLSRARTYAERHGVSFSAIGRAALNDDKFLRRVERGAGFNVITFQRVLDWLDLAEAKQPQSAAAAELRHEKSGAPLSQVAVR